MNQILILIMIVLIIYIIYKSTLVKEGWDSWPLYRPWYFHMDHKKELHLDNINRQFESHSNETYHPEKFCKIDGSDYEGEMSRTISGAPCSNEAQDLFKPYDSNKIMNTNGRCRYSQGDEKADEKTQRGLYGKRPWCYIRQDRFGANWNVEGHSANFFGGLHKDDHWGEKVDKQGKPELFVGAIGHKKRGGDHFYMKPIYYEDYDSYNALINIERHLIFKNLDDIGLVGAQKCWVGTPSYRKWDCIDYETIDDVAIDDEEKRKKFNSIYGKHGVTRKSTTGFIINNGSYEIITKIATSGIMGTENWKESCWTRGDKDETKKYKNFALENTINQPTYTTITEINNHFDNDIYNPKNDSLSPFTTNMHVNNATNNTVFDKNKNNIFGINILGRPNQYPWIHLDCKYGNPNEKPDIDTTFFNADTEKNLKKDNTRYFKKGNMNFAARGMYHSNTDRRNAYRYQAIDIPENSKYYNFDNKAGKILINGSKTTLTRDLIYQDIDNFKSNPKFNKLNNPNNKAYLSLSQSHEKNYNYQEGWMRITLDEKIQLRNIIFYDAYNGTLNELSAKNKIYDTPIKFEIYIYDDKYTTDEEVTNNGKINKIKWPNQKSLQNINKLINSGKIAANNSIFNGEPTLKSPEKNEDDEVDTDAYMKYDDVNRRFMHEFDEHIEARFILIRFTTRTTNYGIRNLSLQRVYNNYQLIFVNDKIQLQDQSGYKIKHQEETDKPEYVNNLIEIGNVQIDNSTNNSKVIKFTNGSYKLKKPIQVPKNNIMMFATWFQVPIQKTGSSHFLLYFESDSTDANIGGGFAPIAIDKFEQKIGCFYNNEFHSSNILLDELKHGWHHLICFVNPLKSNTDEFEIYYYLNGLRKNQDYNWSGKISSNDGTTGLERIDYKLKSIGSDGNTENWGASCANLEINLNFGHQKLYGSDKAETMIYQSIDESIIDDHLLKKKNDLGLDLNPNIDLKNLDIFKLKSLHPQMMDNAVEHLTTKLKRSKKSWKEHTCPNHLKLVNSAINTAKSLSIKANDEKLKREQSNLDKDVKLFIQQAENEAHQEVIDYCSDSKNLIIWDNVDKYCYLGKKIELVVDNTTNLVIKNIQVLAEFENEGEKDWIQDEDTKVQLSSLPNIDKAISASEVKTVIGNSSTSESIAKCGNGYYLTGCKSISDDNYSYSTKFKKDEDGKLYCSAFSNGNSNVNAIARCANISGNGITNKSFFLSDGVNELNANCQKNDKIPIASNKQATLLGCSAYTNGTGNCIDKVYIKKIDGVPTCIAEKKDRCVSGNEINVTANCLISEKPSIGTKTDKDTKLTNINQQIKRTNTKSLPRANESHSISCNKGYLLLDGGCSSDVNDDYPSCSYTENPYENNKFKSINKEDGNGVYAHSNCVKFNVIDDNCIDGSLQTICSTDKVLHPKITFEFGKTIKIKKIIIWNRNTIDAELNLPLHINIKDQYDNIVVTGIKDHYNKPIKIINQIPKTPQGCKNPYIQFGPGFNPGPATVNENDVKSAPSFREWVKLSKENNNNCSYCRIRSDDDSKRLSCTDHNQSSINQYYIESDPNPSGNQLYPFGAHNSQFLHDESDDGKKDFCFVNNDTNSLQCLENSGTRFNNLFSPKDQEYSYSNLTGDKIKMSRTKFDTSKCVTNQSIVDTTEAQCDAGFYCSRLGYYYLFKNSLLDDDEIILFRELSVESNTENEESNCTILNNSNWPGITFSKIDATLYLDFDPEENYTQRDVVYFFSGKQYIKFDLTHNEVIPNSNTNETINQLNSGFFSNLMFEEVTACCYIGNGICWFFNDDKFIQAKLSNKQFQIISNISKLKDNTVLNDIPFNTFDVILYFYNLQKPNILIFKKNEFIDYDVKTRKNRCLNTNLITRHIDDLYNNLWEINISNLFNSNRIHLEKNKLKLQKRIRSLIIIDEKITNIEFDCDN